MRNSIIEADLEFITSAGVPWDALKNKTVLVSGAAGFLPAYMVETMLYLNETRDTNISVIGLVRNHDKALERFAHYEKNKNLTFVVQDVCERIQIAQDIHYIVHAASLATPKVFMDDPVGTLSPNVIGTDNLLRLAAKKQVECFMYFSTSGVHGHVSPDAYPIKETCVGKLNFLDLASCYLESKRMGENMCIAWMKQHGVPVKIVRPAITYGPGIKLDDGRSFADFIACVVNSKDIELYSDGRAVRNFCYLSDATVGFFMVMLKGLVGDAYHVATDHEISILDLATLLVEEVFPERNLKVVMKADPSKNYLRMEFPRTTVDISKARALGWEPRIPVEEGFRRTVDSYVMRQET